MTRLLFLPDDQTLVVLDSPLPAGELMECVNQGRWTPPPPYDAANGVETPANLHAFRLGSLGRTVIITPHLPLDLADPGLDEIRRLLKPRQRQILLLLAHGLSNKEIAVRLNLHPRTVAQHIATLKALFGASSRAQSILKAVDLGFFGD
jgi:DNA-binding CsgD family transcriptional regulator